MFETRKKLKADIKEFAREILNLNCIIDRREIEAYRGRQKNMKLEIKAEKALNFIKAVKCKDSCATNGGLLPLCNRCSTIKEIV